MKDRTDSLTNESAEQNQPFFARFLEGQDTSNLSAMTLKFPSDRDEWPDSTLGNNAQQ